MHRGRVLTTLSVAALLACGATGSPTTRDAGGGTVDRDTSIDLLPDTLIGPDPAAVPDPGPDPDPGPVPDPGPGPDAAPADPGLPPEVAWPAPAPAWVPDGPFYDAHPAAFARFSRFVTRIAGSEYEWPDLGRRGSFGVGNGRVFGFVGLAVPLTTLHSLAGPTYEKGDRFFGDWTVFIRRSQPLELDTQIAGRSLSAPVVVTRSIGDRTELDTIDFAPADGPARDCFVRLLIVRNRADYDTGPLDLVAKPAQKQVVLPDGTLLETAGERRCATRFIGDDAILDHNLTAMATDLALRIDPVAPGQEVRRVLLHCTAIGADPVVPSDVDAGALLDALATAYAAWDADLVHVDVPDPLVADFVDGMKMTLKVQTSAQGATCPMSEYTLTWARDNMGPVIAMLSLGAFADVRAMLDYVYAAIRYRGDLSNAYPADLDPATAPAAPDWDAMAPLSGRVAAETPSYMVLMYGLHHRWTGDLGPATERFGLLRRCLLNQGFGPDRLLPFTGDETYRAAMNAAFGLALEVPYQDTAWSANSSLLWLGAEREYARLASLLGLTDDVTAAGDIAQEVEATTLARYLLSDGCISPFLYREFDEAWPAPFEDVALQVTWSGWKDGDDPLAASTLACLVDRIGMAPGVVQSPLSVNYQDFPGFAGTQGVYTGMLPGYALAAFSDTGHPQAAAAFRAVGGSLDTSGNLQEYHVRYPDREGGLSLVYDDLGGVGDYTAKFRPWEGGIVLDAVLRYLVGLRPDATAGTISLRPHLPDGWPAATYRDLRVGDDRFDLAMTRADDGTVAATLTSRGARSWAVDVRYDHAADATPAVSIDGKAAAEDSLTHRTHLGAASVQTAPVTLAAGATVVFTFVP